MFRACFLFCCGRRGVLPFSLLYQVYLCGVPGGHVYVCVWTGLLEAGNSKGGVFFACCRPLGCWWMGRCVCQVLGCACVQSGCALV